MHFVLPESLVQEARLSLSYYIDLFLIELIISCAKKAYNTRGVRNVRVKGSDEYILIINFLNCWIFNAKLFFNERTRGKRL